MSYITNYNRRKAVAYADKWAMGRNPKYYDFSQLGGDCTNFISQCLFAGSNVMNFTPVYGWYYINLNERTPSWTAVQYFFDFLTTNTQRGVFADEVALSDVMRGDVIQLYSNERYYHSLLVAEHGSVPSEENILVDAHTFNALRRPLSSYQYDKLRVLHINGVYL